MEMARVSMPSSHSTTSIQGAHESRKRSVRRMPRASGAISKMLLAKSARSLHSGSGRKRCVPRWQGFKVARHARLHVQIVFELVRVGLVRHSAFCRCHQNANVERGATLMTMQTRWWASASSSSLSRAKDLLESNTAGRASSGTRQRF